MESPELVAEKVVLFKWRVFTVAGIGLITFIVGTIIYFTISGPGKNTSDGYLIAVMMFPIGFSGLLPPHSGLEPVSVLMGFGWPFYGLCLLVILCQKHRKTFIVTCSLLVIAIILNLEGCSHILKH